MTNEEAKEFLDNLKICISEHPIVADWLVEIVGRKTEPTQNQHIQSVESVESVGEDRKTESDIVRCAECKYKQQCRKAVEHITHEPTSVTIGYKSVDYCSYGERKESE